MVIHSLSDLIEAGPVSSASEEAGVVDEDDGAGGGFLEDGFEL